ncbi:YwaF family protein [Acholeplasma granularum]|uniref:YwaF family protein n=1 Tax=Acholeplasma granularum TaxID=264635 RepID=UPI00046F50FF|nr:YwaF family protein [Acholeplasma granularum]
MNFLLELLNSSMQTPKAYASFLESWFHYLSLLILVISTYFFAKKFKTSTVPQTKKILLMSGLLMIFLEIYKQVIFTYQAGHYQWYAFPFQFCSTPMYLFTIYGISKNKKIDTYLLSFLATYSTFAGIAVMLYPADVFIPTIGINIQTMIHHGLMASIGISLLITKIEFKFKGFLKGSLVFLILLVVALSMNLLFNLSTIDQTFNMFFINERFGNHIPILSLIEPHVNSITFLMIYFIGFSFVAALIWVIGLLIKKSLYKEKINISEIFA